VIARQFGKVRHAGQSVSQSTRSFFELGTGFSRDARAKSARNNIGEQPAYPQIRRSVVANAYWPRAAKPPQRQAGLAGVLSPRRAISRRSLSGVVQVGARNVLIESLCEPTVDRIPMDCRINPALTITYAAAMNFLASLTPEAREAHGSRVKWGRLRA
jgi:hypothetical protein